MNKKNTITIKVYNTMHRLQLHLVKDSPYASYQPNISLDTIDVTISQHFDITFLYHLFVK